MKDAKTAHKKKADAAEAAASKLVMVSDGHRVSSNVTGKADCGEWIVGWRYGEAKDVTCKYCVDGTQQGDIDVPPRPTTEEEFAALPILDVEALAAEHPA